MLKKFLFNKLLLWGKKLFHDEFQKILHKNSVRLNEEYYPKETPLTEFFNQENYFKNDYYKLLDAGCSGGISFYWHRIKYLSVIGIDLAKEDINKLNKEKKNNSEKYIYAQIINKNNFATKFDHEYHGREQEEIGFQDTGAKKILNIFDKLEVKPIRIMTTDTRTEELLVSAQKKTLKEICEENNFTKLNFVDIDLDGHSLDGLASLESLIQTPELFGIKVEVDFTEKSSGQYFLKIAELMHEHNFTLIKVLPRKYGTFELPNQFSYNFPAQSIDGFDHQGDLIYIKTINKDSIKNLDKTNFCKFMVTLEMINLQGLAIKLINLENKNFFETETKAKFKDLLTIAPSKANFGKIMNYQEYQKKVQEDPYSLMSYAENN